MAFVQMPSFKNSVLFSKKENPMPLKFGQADDPVGEWIGDEDALSLKSPRSKTSAASRGFLFQPALQEHCNEMGNVEAGYLLKLIDTLGAVPLFRHMEGKSLFVTASLDRLNFINPIKAWDFIKMKSRITKVFNHSAEVQIDVSAYGYRRGEPTEVPVASAHLVFVALDRNRKPTHVPPLIETSIEDFHRAQGAEVRKIHRKEEEQAAPYIPLGESDTPYITEISETMSRKHTNITGNVFGGVILEILEKAGREAAKNQALGEIIAGVRMDRMSFIAPGFKGETVHARATVTKTWKTSMEVQVEIEAINPNQPETPRKIASCYLVYVHLNEHGEPAQLPEWTPKTEAQKKRAEAADLRRSLREQEEKSLADHRESLEIPLKQRLVLFFRDKAHRIQRSWAVLTR